MPHPATVAFVGLGNMGIPMAAAIANAGYRVIGFDASVDACERARAVALEVAESIAAAVTRADIVILMLPNSSAVESVLGDTVVRDALKPGCVVVDMGSSEPLSTQALARDLAQRGVDMVDAPVSGGVKGAVAATLTIMAGGDDHVLDSIDGVLAATGTVRRTGPTGSGHALKALNNMLSATHLLVSSEAIEVGRRFGLADDVMLDVINESSGKNWSTEFKWPTYIVTETFNSGFGLRLLAKDVRIAADLGRQLGLPCRLGEASLALWEQAATELPADADHTEIARFAASPDAS